MNAYSEAFYRYIQEHPLKYHDVEIESVLELFYECYAEGALRDTPEMKACIHRLYELTSPRVGDELLHVLSAYALEGEKRAFLEGVRVGGKWGLEIRGIENGKDTMQGKPCAGVKKLV